MKTKMFLAGAAVGALVSALVHVVAFRPPHRPPEPPPPGQMETMLLNHFSDELSLTEDQRAAAAPIIKELHKQTLALRLSHQDEMEKILSDADRQLMPILTSEQQKLLERRRLHMREGRRRDEMFLRGHRGPPPGPPPD